MLVFNYLTGTDLYHKIALLDKITWVSLPEPGLLDSVKVLRMKSVPSNYRRLTYAFELIDIVELVAKNDTIMEVN